MRCSIARKSVVALFVGAGLAFLADAASAGLLYDPIVTVIGDGAHTTSGSGFTTSIDLFSNSVANQTSSASSVSYNSGTTGTRLVASYSGTSEGSLTNNPALANAAATGAQYTGTGYAYSAGYDAANNTAGVNGSTANANRSVGKVTVAASSLSDATVVKTQPDSSAYKNDNFRGAVGDDTATNLYSAGNGSGTTNGWRNFNTNSLLANSPTNTRNVELLGGKLFGVTGKGSVGIYMIDPSGNGTASPATSFLITGTDADHSPYEFALFDDPTNTHQTNGYNVAYIADDGTFVAAGGIEKWTYNGSAWTQAYILKDNTSTYYRGLAGELDASTGLVTLFATTADGTKLQQVTDTGINSAFTTLATANTDYVFRGVALAPANVPEPGTLVLLGTAMVAAAVAFLRRKIVG